MNYSITLICDTTKRNPQIDFNFSRDFKYKTLIDWKKNEYIFTFKNKRDYETAKDITLYNMIYKTYKWIYKKKLYKDNILINSINMTTDYNQLYNSVMEELEIEMGDLQFRRNIKGMNRYYYPFMLLELKQEILKRKNIGYTVKDEPIYTGKCYVYKKVSKYHQKIKQPKHPSKHSNIYNSPSFENIKDDEVIKKWFLEEFRFVKDIEFNVIHWTQQVRTEYGNKQWEYFRKNHKGHIKIRVIYQQINYKNKPIPFYSLCYIKKWDKETKKTNNKGTKKDEEEYWCCTDGKYKTWSLTGLKANDMEYWAIENGFKKETEQTQTKKGLKSVEKKYYYGDYAEYLLNLEDIVGTYENDGWNKPKWVKK